MKSFSGSSDSPRHQHDGEIVDAIIIDDVAAHPTAYQDISLSYLLEGGIPLEQAVLDMEDGGFFSTGQWAAA